MDNHTMSNEMTPVEVARKKFKASLIRDDEGVLECMAENVILRVPGKRPLAGTYHGHAGVSKFAKGSRSGTDDGEHIEIVDIMGGDTHAAAIIRLNASYKGVKLDDPTIHLMKVENGKITEYTVYPWDQYKADEFWLASAGEVKTA